MDVRELIEIYGKQEDNLGEGPVIIPPEKLNEFWRGIYPKGMTMDKALDELSDMAMIIDHVTTVYHHFSGGMISKPNTLPIEVIMMSDRREQNDLDAHVEDILETISEVYDIPVEELKDCV